MQRQYRQITCKRAIDGANFDKGIIDVDFSIGGKTTWTPSKSYFRIGLKLTKADGSTSLEQTDNVAYANLAPGNLFDNVYFMAGGQTVSSIVNYAPQAHAASYRLSKSGAWLNSIGKDAYGYNPDFNYRRLEASTTVPSDTVIVSPPQDISEQGDAYFMYQPPIGIMQHSKPMGSGDYRFQFNPNANYKTAIVESSAAAKNPGVDYQVEVTSMELYICTEMMDVSPSGTEVLHLMEHQVQSKPLGGAGDKNFDFTVPPSTKAISLFIQSGASGTNTLCPPSNFKCQTGANYAAGFDAQDSIKSLQITYANITKPPTRWSSTFVPIGQPNVVRKLQQRYLDTQIESSQAYSSGGCETLQQWLEGGVLLHYSWIRDANDRSTQLQLQIDYSQFEAGSNIFLISHYTKSVEMQVDQGYISSIVSLTI